MPLVAVVFLIVVNCLVLGGHATRHPQKNLVAVLHKQSARVAILKVIVIHGDGILGRLAVNGERVVGLGRIQNIVVLRNVKKETNACNINIVLANLINIVV
jgi:hypothetical protein